MELTIPPLVVPCVIVFVGLKLVKAHSVRVSLCGALIALKSVDTLVVLAEVPAVDGYWTSFAMTGNTDRLFTLAERVACAENHDVFLSGTVWNAKTKLLLLHSRLTLSSDQPRLGPTQNVLLMNIRYFIF